MDDITTENEKLEFPQLPQINSGQSSIIKKSSVLVASMMIDTVEFYFDNTGTRSE